jgi:uncharacterized protein
MLTLEQARHWYPADDPVHGFEHVLRVYRMAERLALAEGADLEIVRAAVLLHDAQDSQAGRDEEQAEKRGNHHLRSAEFAAKVLEAEGWPVERITAVQHCIQAHRFRDDSTAPQTLEAQVLFDADKLDAIGAIGVVRALAFAISAGNPVYSPVSPGFRRTGALQAGETHSAYHEYLFKLVKLKDRLHTASARSLAEQRHARMVEFFEGLAAEMES